MNASMKGRAARPGRPSAVAASGSGYRVRPLVDLLGRVGARALDTRGSCLPLPWRRWQRRPRPMIGAMAQPGLAPFADRRCGDLHTHRSAADYCLRRRQDRVKPREMTRRVAVADPARLAIAAICTGITRIRAHWRIAHGCRKSWVFLPRRRAAGHRPRLAVDTRGVARARWPWRDPPIRCAIRVRSPAAFAAGTGTSNPRPRKYA